MLRLQTSCAVLLDGGVGEMTNLYNHQANRRVSAATMAYAAGGSS